VETGVGILRTWGGNIMDKGCRGCGNVLPLTTEFYHKHNSSKDGFRHDCKECRKKENKSSLDRYHKNRTYRLARMQEYAKRPIPKAKKYIRDYIRIDSKKGVECDLTVEFMLGIFTQPCVYCGDFSNIGCDRIHNHLGHLQDNVVPCCATCNVARSNNFTHEEMFILGNAIKTIKAKRAYGLEDI
jgi:hypothetical protein